MTERFQDICVLLHCCKANPLLRCIGEWRGRFVPSLIDPLAGTFDLPVMTGNCGKGNCVKVGAKVLQVDSTHS